MKLNELGSQKLERKVMRRQKLERQFKVVGQACKLYSDRFTLH